MKFLIAMLALIASSAHAYEVYSDKCEMPTFKADAKTFYLDPVNGSLTGDGSKEKPFPSLEKVIAAGLIDRYGWQPVMRPCKVDQKQADGTVIKVDSTCRTYTYPDTMHSEKLVRVEHANKNWKIPVGSKLVLLTGDHGSAQLSGYHNDTGWIEIAGGEGEKPILHLMQLNGGNRFAFRNLTIEPLPGKNGLNIVEGGWTGPTSQVVADKINVYTPGLDPHESDKAEIRSKMAAVAFFLRDSECVSLTNSKSYMTEFGTALYSNRLKYEDLDAQVDKGERYILVKGNEFSYMTGGDGLDFAGHYIRVENNYIHDTQDVDTGLHFDLVQGQNNSGRGDQHNSNIVFINNRLIRQTDPKLKYATYAQGLSSFQGLYEHVLFENNLIVTTHWHCITQAGGTDVTWKNNTCLPDGSTNKNYGANQPWMTPWPGGTDGYIGDDFKFIDNVGFQLQITTPKAADPAKQTLENLKLIASKKIESHGNVMSSAVLTMGDYNDPQFNVDGTPILDANGKQVKKIVHRMGSMNAEGTYEGGVVKKTLWADFPNLDRANYKFDLSGVKETSPAFGKGYQPPKPACDCKCN